VSLVGDLSTYGRVGVALESAGTIACADWFR
jgi:hypothetical protein